MKRKVPIKENIPYVFEPTTEMRIVVSPNGVKSIIEFDSTRLDLGSAEEYDLDNMLKAGVQPGVARPRPSSSIESFEANAAFADALLSANPQTAE